MATTSQTEKVENGIINDVGRPHGYLYPNKKYWNFTLRFEYEYQPYEGMESDDDLFSNTGYLLFITKPDVWPRTLEIFRQWSVLEGFADVPKRHAFEAYASENGKRDG